MLQSQLSKSSKIADCLIFLRRLFVKCNISYANCLLFSCSDVKLVFCFAVIISVAAITLKIKSDDTGLLGSTKISLRFSLSYFTRIFVPLPVIVAVYYFRAHKLIGWEPANIYLFKINTRNTRKRCEICPKLTTNRT